MDISNTIIRIRNRYRRSLSIHYGQRLLELRPKFPIISFTFDDFPRSALLEGGAILQRHGICGTYYVSLGLLGRELPAGPGFLIEDLRQVIAEGHELGCHTFAHCHSWETTPGVFEKSIIKNKHALGELVPGAAFKTLSYPIACPRPRTKRRAARHFVCCRGGGESFNVGPTDVSNLQARFLEKSRDNPDALKRLIDENTRASGWLILATHDIAETPTPFGCTPAFFEVIVQWAVTSGARILPVARAWEEITAK
jgi:peptidoglycan/xylan/chitin deacetylase (PgdA/CDA1 family)